MPTLPDDQIPQGEGHGVAREDVVTAVHVLPIDRQPSSRHDGQDPLYNDLGGDVV